MLDLFVVSGGVGFVVVSLLLVHGMRDTVRGVPARPPRPLERTGRWRYEAAVAK